MMIAPSGHALDLSEVRYFRIESRPISTVYALGSEDARKRADALPIDARCYVLLAYLGGGAEGLVWCDVFFTEAEAKAYQRRLVEQRNAADW